MRTLLVLQFWEPAFESEVELTRMQFFWFMGKAILLKLDFGPNQTKPPLFSLISLQAGSTLDWTSLIKLTVLSAALLMAVSIAGMPIIRVYRYRKLQLNYPTSLEPQALGPQPRTSRIQVLALQQVWEYLASARGFRASRLPTAELKLRPG